MLLASRGIGCTQTVPGAENGAGNPTFQFKRSAIENSSLFTNALGNVDAILPFRMMAVSHHDLEIGILVHRVYHDSGIGLLEKGFRGKGPGAGILPVVEEDTDPVTAQPQALPHARSVVDSLLRIAVLAGLQKRHCRIVCLFLFCRYLNGLTVNHHNLRFEYGKALVERYAVQVDPQLHREVRDRYYALGIEPYGGFVNPEFELVEKDGKTMDSYRKKLMNDFSFMSYAPIIFISAKTGLRLDRLFELIKYVDDQNAMRISTGRLNDLLADATARVQPPTDKGRRLKIFYMTQASTRPPTFVCFVNRKDLFHYSYQRYIDNQIRSVFGLEGTPTRMIIRERESNKK